MAEAIRPLTIKALRASARAAAEQHIPLREANDFCQDTDHWNTFNSEYRAREWELHRERLLAEVA